MNAPTNFTTERVSPLVRRLIAPADGPRCSRGHEMTKYNTYERGGRRWCRECHRERQATYRLKSRAASA